MISNSVREWSGNCLKVCMAKRDRNKDSLSGGENLNITKRNGRKRRDR